MKLLPLLAASAAFLPLLTAQDDRDRDTPVGAVWYSSQTTTDLSNLANSGWRFTDLEIQSTSPWSLTVSAVQNTGSYQKGWLYLIGVTGAQLSTSINQNNARIVDLEPYDDNGTTRFVAILIGNSGADQKTWWWGYDMTSAQVDASVTTNNGRLTNLERYTVGGQTRFAMTMISNTGADQRSWGYLYGASSATINLNIALNQNRIYDIERIGTDSYDVVLVQNGGFGHWYYFDQTATAVTELLQQNIGRLVDLERHTTLLGTRYTVAMIDNANTLESTARSSFLTAGASALGDYGFFLKEVNGPVLAEMRADTTFEPASTMKTVYHVHAMKRVLQGATTLGTLINKPVSCGNPGGNQTLELTLRQMMENSDNYSTLAVSNYFGIPNIQSTANALGMGSTSINFTIGCSGPAPESTLTLRDLSTLHEAVANGYLGSLRDEFYDLMAESLSFPTWGTTDLDTRINTQAALLGISSQVRDVFKSQLHIAYKPGGIGWTDPGPWTYYYAEGGWMSVPFRGTNGQDQTKEYTFGVFNYLFTGTSNEVPGRNAMSAAELDLVWDRVKAALATWVHYTPGQLTTLLGAGCMGSSGIPVHTAHGTAETGGSVGYRVDNVPILRVAAAMFGFQNQTFNGAPLPIDLAILGAPGCLLRIDAAILEPAVTLVGAEITVGFPNSPSLIGAQLYSQWLVNDPPANAFGWTYSNALRTTLGGWQ